MIPKLPISQANIDLFNSYPANKKDDVADAMLIALYHAQKMEEPPKRPKKRSRKK
jgi:Holliday junction resolvasome RuvABC endonuclease subunit